jgi:putative ABC transport system permease protein
MLRCFGASRRRALALFVLQFAALGIVASVAGIALALAGQSLLVALLASVAPTELPPPSVLPAITAFGTGVLLLFGFALPPLIALASVPPLRVLRRDLPRPRPGGIFAYLLGAGVIALLIAWQAQDAKAGAIMIGGIGGLLAAAAFTAWILIVVLKRLPQRGATWRFGLANLRRRPLASSLQIGALALGFMALLLLTVVRGDLMQNWRASLPADAPNHFVLNVLPDQVDGVRAAMKARRARHPALSDDSRTAVASTAPGSTPRSTPTPAHAGWRSGSSIFHTPPNCRIPTVSSAANGSTGHRPGSGHLDGARHRGVVASQARRRAHVRHRGHAGDRDDQSLRKVDGTVSVRTSSRCSHRAA